MKTKKPSFTLLETIVTISIYAIMLLMITNIIVINSRLNEQIKMRSRIRTELSQLATSIKRDIRNADSINPEECQLAACTMSVLGSVVKWNLQSGKLVKTVDDVITVVNADYLIFESINFTTISDTESNNTKASVIMTIKAKGKKEVWNVDNQIIQDIISIRQYDLNQ